MKKYSEIFSPTACVPEGKLMQYVAGTLSPADKHEVEKHLVDCEMCSDAVEGMKLMVDKTKASSITAELKQKIQQRAEKKEVKIIFLKQYRTQLAVAASVVVIVGLVWFFRNTALKNDMPVVTSDNNMLAEQVVPPPIVEETKQADENTMSEESGVVTVQNESKEEDVAVIKKKVQLVEKEEPSKYAMLKENNRENSSEKQDINKLIETKATHSEEEVDVAERSVALEPVSVAVSSDKAAKQKKAESSDDLNGFAAQSKKTTAVPSSIASPETPAMAEDLEKTLSKDLDDYSAMYYTAVLYVKAEEKTDKAIENLNKVLEKKDGVFYDDAKWYLALAYLQKKDVAAARLILEELKNNSKSKHQKEAVEKLEQLSK